MAPNERPVTTYHCVCNGCVSDSDCKAKAGGKCQRFSLMCTSTAMACVYPGDLCAGDGSACQTSGTEPKQCTHDRHGHAVCGPFQWPPPAAAH